MSPSRAAAPPAPVADPAATAGGLAVTIAEISGADVDALRPELTALYAACYAGPPWHEGERDVDRYAARLGTWAALDSFTGLTAHARAHDGDDAGPLVAAAYGWQGPPESQGVPLPGIAAARPFHLADLMVHPTAQRRGIGRTLLDRCTRGRRPAVLLTHPDAAARRLYEAAGWRCTGTVELPATAPLLVYLLA